jgi:hypothetical protein
VVYHARSETSKYNAVLATLEQATGTVPFEIGQGIFAASADDLDTGFGFDIDRRLHLGATAWTFFARHGINPFEPIVPVGTHAGDTLTLRLSTDGTRFEVLEGNPPAPGAAPEFSWPLNSSLPLSINTLAGNDTVVVELPAGAAGPAAGIRLNLGAGSNNLLVKSGNVRIDSTATGGMLSTTVLGTAHLTTTRFGQSALTLADNSRATLLAGGGTSLLNSLVVGSGATLDITNNALVIDYATSSPAATIRAEIIEGRGGAGLGKPWNGTGITSSAAAQANSAAPDSRSVGYTENALLPLGPYMIFRGVPVDATSVLIAYTRTGDANLDGIVNNDDVTVVGANFAPGQAKPAASAWALGDFEYNGFVDNDDVTLLGAFYNPAATPAAPTNEEGRSTKDEVLGTQYPVHSTIERADASHGTEVTAVQNHAHRIARLQESSIDRLRAADLAAARLAFFESLPKLDDLPPLDEWFASPRRKKTWR